MSKKYAVLGSPIQHSKSPAIHNAAFAFQGKDATYEQIELAAELDAFLSGEGAGFSGLSLTMPLKEQALMASARADSLAIVTGAANTLVRADQGWDAYNTDVFGIQQALSAFKFKTVGVIGSGATARSAIVAMQELNKDVNLWARNSDSAMTLSREFEIATQDKFHQVAKADVVISTLPANALDAYLDEIRWEPENVLLDVAYSPWPSKAAEIWEKRGSVVSGLEMLIWQAVGQQRLFGGNDLDEPLENEKGLISAIRSALEMAN